MFSSYISLYVDVVEYWYDDATWPVVFWNPQQVLLLSVWIRQGWSWWQWINQNMPDAIASKLAPKSLIWLCSHHLIVVLQSHLHPLVLVFSVILNPLGSPFPYVCCTFNWCQWYAEIGHAYDPSLMRMNRPYQQTCREGLRGATLT